MEIGQVNLIRFANFIRNVLWSALREMRKTLI